MGETLAELVAEQEADDATPYVAPEPDPTGRPIANATDRRLEWDQTARFRELEHLRRLDADIDAGRYIRWLDDPVAWWRGEGTEEAMYLGVPLVDSAGKVRVDRKGKVRRGEPAACPICHEGPRPRGAMCGYCLRQGMQTRLPMRTPTRLISIMLEVQARKVERQEEKDREFARGKATKKQKKAAGLVERKAG